MNWKSHGFSMVELLAVLAVLSILAWASMPLLEVSRQREKERELKQALRDIRSAIDAYRKAVESGLIEGGASGYPRALAELTEGCPNLKRPGEKVFFMRKIPTDPFAASGTPADQSWGLRSYASSPDRPQPGEDVFDVFSRSGQIALNGSPLKNW